MKARKQAAHARGVEAEQRCAELLQAKGYKIVGMRLRTKGGELDIVARDGDVLVIVEVKARRTHDAGLYAITPAKQKRLVRAATAFLAGLGGAAVPNMRFDVMAVGADGAPLHLQDAWRPNEEYA